MLFQKGSFGVPVAIIIAGVLIAGALYFALSQKPTSATPGTTPTQTAEPVRGVQADDHIKGNPDAKVVIVEYSDPECPFCKRMHETMNTIVNQYAPEDVAWVYRHLPIPQLHQKAQAESEALECAATVGGNDGFWAYTDALYAETPSNDGLDLSRLPEIAEEVGLDRTAFEQCVKSGEVRERITRDTNEAWAAGAQGTPHNVVIVGDQQIPIPGYVDAPTLSNMLDQFLAQ